MIDSRWLKLKSHGMKFQTFDDWSTSAVFKVFARLNDAFDLFSGGNQSSLKIVCFNCVVITVAWVKSRDCQVLLMIHIGGRQKTLLSLTMPLSNGETFKQFRINLNHPAIILNIINSTHKLIYYPQHWKLLLSPVGMNVNDSDFQMHVFIKLEGNLSLNLCFIRFNEKFANAGKYQKTSHNLKLVSLCQISANILD